MTKILDEVAKYTKRLDEVAARLRIRNGPPLREIVTSGQYCGVCGCWTHRALTGSGQHAALCSLHLQAVREALAKESIPI